MKNRLAYITEELKPLYSKNEIKTLSELIFKHLLNYSRTEYLLSQDKQLDETTIGKVESVVGRLKKHEPFQYIAEEADFYGLKFKVSPSVLIPRPETEELVHWIVSENKTHELKVLDIGTGSGCIAVSLAANLVHSKVFATDISKEALAVAVQNAEANHVNVSFFESDILNYKKNEVLSNNRFDLIVSNPPYVRNSEKKDMQANVLEYEPPIALFVSDQDPLVFYREIANYAATNLKDNGKLFFEINEYLPNELFEMLINIGFNHIELKKDINGKNRMAQAVWF